MDLYAQNILDHNKHPHHFGELKGANACSAGGNPLCGDKMAVSINVNKKGVIEDAMFTGSGCAISKASADLLIEDIIGKKASVVRKYTADEVYALLGVKVTPARVKCALLALTLVKEALLKKS
jgi:nitrogen fixation protein NifU and related proteins